MKDTQGNTLPPGTEVLTPDTVVVNGKSVRMVDVWFPPPETMCIDRGPNGPVLASPYDEDYIECEVPGGLTVAPADNHRWL